MRLSRTNHPSRLLTVGVGLAVTAMATVGYASRAQSKPPTPPTPQSAPIQPLEAAMVSPLWQKIPLAPHGPTPILPIPLAPHGTPNLIPLQRLPFMRPAVPAEPGRTFALRLEQNLPTAKSGSTGKR